MARKARDFTGEKFGKLTVIKLSHTFRIGKRKHLRSVWLCQCDCGRTEKVLHVALTRKKNPTTSCMVCKRGNCVLCGSPIPKEFYKPRVITCSEACRKEWIKVTDSLRYLGKLQENPNMNREEYRRRLESDPDFLRKAHVRKRLNFSKLPEAEQRAILNRQNKRARERYAEAIADPEKGSAFILKRRIKARKRLERIKADPEKYSDHRAKDNHSARVYRSTKALAELQAVGKTLIDKSNEE